MTDICERLRREVAWEQDIGELLEEAAAEITRLRLTDAEREAVEGMASYFDTRGNLTMQAWGSLLHVLLERTK